MEEKKKGRIKRWYDQVMAIVNKSYNDNLAAMAGHSAFFLLLSAIPMILFAFSLFSLLTGKDIQVSDFPEINNEVLHPIISSLLNYIVDSVHKATSGTAIITAIVMLWSAGKGMYCITDGILRIYGAPNKRFWVFKRIYAMGYTLVLLLIIFIGMIITAINFVLAGTIILNTGVTFQLHWLVSLVMTIVLVLLESVLLTFALKLFLRNKVETPAYYSFHALYPGMLMTVLAWKVLTFGIVFYIRHFAVSSIYGSLASVFMAMIWVYFEMYILLYGVQINYYFRKEFSSFRLFKKHKNKQIETVDQDNADQEKESNA